MFRFLKNHFVESGLIKSVDLGGQTEVPAGSPKNARRWTDAFLLSILPNIVYKNINHTITFLEFVNNF